MIKKILVASIAGAGFYFLIGWLIFDFILGAFTEQNTTQLAGFKKDAAEFSYLWLVVSCMAYAILLSYVLVYLARIENIGVGVLAGAIIGILIAVMTDSYWYASSHYYSNFYALLVDVLGAAVSVGLTGGVVVQTGKMV